MSSKSSGTVISPTFSLPSLSPCPSPSLSPLFFLSSDLYCIYPWHHTAECCGKLKLHHTREAVRMFLLTTVLLFGFASGQKVIQLTYCSLKVDDLRMDCKYSLSTESSEAFCKYTQGERLLDTTDPKEEQHAPFKKRAKVRIFPGNYCRLRFINLPNGKSNFTCNIKQADNSTAFKTSVVEKKLLLPCSAWSVLLQGCSGLLLTLMTLPMLLEIHWL